jgi:hypothetical protein
MEHHAGLQAVQALAAAAVAIVRRFGGNERELWRRSSGSHDTMPTTTTLRRRSPSPESDMDESTSASSVTPSPASSAPGNTTVRK